MSKNQLGMDGMCSHDLTRNPSQCANFSCCQLTQFVPRWHFYETHVAFFVFLQLSSVFDAVANSSTQVWVNPEKQLLKTALENAREAKAKKNYNKTDKIIPVVVFNDTLWKALIVLFNILERNCQSATFWAEELPYGLSVLELIFIFEPA